jgi:hypothetical protein
MRNQLEVRSGNHRGHQLHRLKRWPGLLASPAANGPSTWPLARATSPHCSAAPGDLSGSCRCPEDGLIDLSGQRNIVFRNRRRLEESGRGSSDRTTKTLSPQNKTPPLGPILRWNRDSNPDILMRTNRSTNELITPKRKEPYQRAGKIKAPEDYPGAGRRACRARWLTHCWRGMQFISPGEENPSRQGAVCAAARGGGLYVPLLR